MLSFESIHYAYDAVPVLKDLSFSAAPGEITCVVGPSGCGKSTLLGLAAGLLEVQKGEIRLDDTVLGRPGFNLAPEQRPVGLVFQEGALFPHLSVARNIGFGLGAAERPARVAELLTLVGLEAEADRLPHTLSGGQQQRVALARALAPRPRALLFDEPYANLDQALRRTLRREARDMVRASGTIGVFVTHDPDDVMALANQVVVLGDGELVQIGTPRALYEAPSSAAVAGLFGLAQLMEGRFESDPESAATSAAGQGSLLTAFGRWPGSSIAPSTDAALLSSGRRLQLCLRPEALNLEACGSAQQAGEPLLRLDDLRMAGADDLAEVVNEAGGRLVVRLPRNHGLQAGERVRLWPRTGGVFLFAS